MRNLSQTLFFIILATMTLASCNGETAAPTEMPAPTLTHTPEPTPTITPRPTKTPIPPTPTAEYPALLQNYLEDVVVINTDDFSSSEGWNLWSGEISSGVLEVAGGDKWQGLGKKGTFPEGTGILLNFKYEKDSVFEIYYDHGEWKTDEYRRFGIYYWESYPRANLWLGKKGLGFNSLTGNLKPDSETWYTLLMATDKDGEFLAVIWDNASPGRTAVYHEKNEKWADYVWNLRIGVNTGAVVFDDFMAIEFSEIK